MLAWVWHPLPRREHMSLTLFLVSFYTLVGAYWLVRPLKVGVFVALVGLSSEPEAKLGTLVVLLPILLGYNAAVARVTDMKRLVAVVAGAYAAIFAAIGLVLPIALASSSSPSPSLSASWAWLGWVTDWVIESFGSVCVAMMWSVLSSVLASRPKATAAHVYPLAVVVCQLGAITGASLATRTASLGFGFMFFVGAAAVAGVIVTSSAAVSYAAASAAAAPSEAAEAGLLSGGQLAAQIETLEDKNAPQAAASASHLPPPRGGRGSAAQRRQRRQTGLLEGLIIIGTDTYVGGILVVSTFAELIGTILDYQMKVVAKREYATPEAFAGFMGYFGVAVNSMSLVFALVGTKRFLAMFGLRAALLAYPLGCASVVGLVYLAPSLAFMFVGMVALKAFNYSLNNPAKELLYLSTTPDVRFKAKSWIDMFGTRLAKGVGASITARLKNSTAALLESGSLVSAGFAAVWIMVASSVGRQYARRAAAGSASGS